MTNPSTPRMPTPTAQEPMKDERGWVIEHHEPLPTGLLLYWRSSKLQLLGRGLEHHFDPKHEMAVRFARKEDADRIISWLEVPGKAVEHLWIGDKPSSALSVQPEALRALIEKYQHWCGELYTRETRELAYAITGDLMSLLHAGTAQEK